MGDTNIRPDDSKLPKNLTPSDENTPVLKPSDLSAEDDMPNIKDLENKGTSLPEAEDHGLTAGIEGEGPNIPEGAGAPTAPLLVPLAESAEGLPPIGVVEDRSPIATFKSTAPTPTEVLPSNPEMVAKFVTDDRLDALWARADTAKKKVDATIHTLDVGRALLDQIMYARNYLLSGRQSFEEAERHINEVELRVSQNVQSRKWSTSYGVPILIYEILCAVGLVLLFFILSATSIENLSEDLEEMLKAMVWGGLGGVAGAWLALIKHTSQQQDFDKQHTLWYINSPFMGALIGAFIYWVIRAGLISITAGNVKSIASPYIIYILAWLAGYQHNVFTAIVKRILKILEVGTEENTTAKKEAKPSEAPKPPIPDLDQSEPGSEEGPDKRG